MKKISYFIPQTDTLSIQCNKHFGEGVVFQNGYGQKELLFLVM